MKKLLFVCLILTCVLQCQLLPEEQLQRALETGRINYEAYQNEASKDECWRKAVESLNETCRGLSQTAQQRLAIAFANCHWASAERPTYECSDEMSIAKCTREMSESAFDVYTQFFNHIEDACFYLQSQLWQEKTDQLITNLSDTSEEAVTKITESLKRHEILEKGQKQSLDNQHRLIETGEKLEHQLDSARQEVSDAFTSIQQQAWSFKEQFNEIFISLSDGLDKVNKVLVWLLGEFVGFERFVVLLVGMVTAYILTCSQYTAQARPLLMMTVVFENMFLERFVVNWYLTSGEAVTTSIMDGLHFILWIIRYCTAFVCFLLLMYYYISYRNYEVVNHQLLKKIIEQNRQIKRHLKLDTEEIDESTQDRSWFIPSKTSTPSTVPFTSEVAVLSNRPVLHPPVQSVESDEVGKPDKDSVDGDQPDSGIEEVDSTKEAPTKHGYNLRKRCKNRPHNKLLEHESPKQFADVIFQSEQLTRRRLRYSHNSSSLLMTPKTPSF